jgi:uncharacterized protein YbaR (Trm112 family)
LSPERLTEAIGVEEKKLVNLLSCPMRKHFPLELHVFRERESGAKETATKCDEYFGYKEKPLSELKSMSCKDYYHALMQTMVSNQRGDSRSRISKPSILFREKKSIPIGSQRLWHRLILPK